MVKRKPRNSKHISNAIKKLQAKVKKGEFINPCLPPSYFDTLGFRDVDPELSFTFWKSRYPGNGEKARDEWLKYVVHQRACDARDKIIELLKDCRVMHFSDDPKSPASKMVDKMVLKILKLAAIMLVCDTWRQTIARDGIEVELDSRNYRKY